MVFVESNRNSCVKGTYGYRSDSSSYYRWICKGLNGGVDSYCSKRIPCTCGGWSPSRSSKCSGTSFTQTRTCNPDNCLSESRSTTGTKYCSSPPRSSPPSRSPPRDDPSGTDPPPSCKCSSWSGPVSWQLCVGTTGTRTRSCTGSACEGKETRMTVHGTKKSSCFYGSPCVGATKTKCGSKIKLCSCPTKSEVEKCGCP